LIFKIHRFILSFNLKSSLAPPCKKLTLEYFFSISVCSFLNSLYSASFVEYGFSKLSYNTMTKWYDSSTAPSYTVPLLTSTSTTDGKSTRLNDLTSSFRLGFLIILTSTKQYLTNVATFSSALVMNFSEFIL